MQIAVTGVTYDANTNTIIVAATVSPALHTGAPDPEPHRFLVPVAAIASRRDLYDVATWADAFTAVMREHFHRLNKSQPTTGDRKTMAAGTLTTGVQVNVPVAVRDQLTAVIQQVRTDLRDEFEARTGPRAALAVSALEAKGYDVTVTVDADGGRSARIKGNGVDQTVASLSELRQAADSLPRIPPAEPDMTGGNTV